MARQKAAQFDEAVAMRRLAAIAFVLTLAGCGGVGNSTVKAVQEFVLQHCGVLVDATSVGAVTATGQPLAGAAIKAVGNAICTAYKNKGSMVTLFRADNCPMVDGVCVQGEVADRKKLDAYRPPEQ